MSDLNDLSKPTPTDTEPNVLDTIRAHIVRAITWTGYSATANKVAGMMSAVTAAVSGGRSLRLYRRNDANTADEEVISLPSVSVGGNAATASAAQSGSALETALANKAPLASPAFSGTPTVPTASSGTNSTQAASTAFVATAVANVVNTAPAALDTLNELAAALGNDPNFATTITNALANKAPLNSPAFTGTPTVPTASAGTNSPQAASTAFVAAAIANLVASSPAALDTLNELAAALGNDPNFATTITNALANKAPLNGTGASGTWSISISGNAATATTTGKGNGNLSNNLANGTDALKSITLGDYNTGTGYRVLYNNTDGGSNTANGNSVLYSNISGFANTGMGSAALYKNTSGSYNTAVGYSALYSNLIGQYNTAVGNFALNSNTESSNSAYGYYSQFSNTTYYNCSSFGYYSSVTGSNQVQLGNSSTSTYVYGTVQNRSDLRDKADVRETKLGLDFINALRPVDYRWDMRDYYRESPETAPFFPERKESETDELFQSRIKNFEKLSKEWFERNKLENIKRDGSKKRSRFHHGLIAQEVKAVMNDMNVDFGGYQDHSVNGGDDVLSIGYDELIAPLIKSVQELSAKVKVLEAKVK